MKALHLACITLGRGLFSLSIPFRVFFDHRLDAHEQTGDEASNSHDPVQPEETE
ncbi:hypothetical protein [Ammoniphilus sp. 3BR4]|uniref:hypothetical protein n=1 Tax=Ammoniphilus sp. 3BR4 TaxID=3158265 RepID=UPI0034655F02